MKFFFLSTVKEILIQVANNKVEISDVLHLSPDSVPPNSERVAEVLVLVPAGLVSITSVLPSQNMGLLIRFFRETEQEVLPTAPDAANERTI